MFTLAGSLFTIPRIVSIWESASSSAHSVTDKTKFGCEGFTGEGLAGAQVQCPFQATTSFGRGQQQIVLQQSHGVVMSECFADPVPMNCRDNVQRPRLSPSNVLLGCTQQIGQLPGFTHPELWICDVIAGGHDTILPLSPSKRSSSYDRNVVIFSITSVKLGARAFKP
ncbi:hypothetical protein [Fodinicola feengrottensis]|uniref:hypothetical protein n=1 Tax=Fodinicola feengrottensis TaxID=435914 RepID=UPI0013D5F0B9|nr:hypothetical protein [Fodinicola feengrottensis]